jgi:glycosyltransferase involved in cell wall biosynthesis
MTAGPGTPLRVFYAAGPGDVVQTYRVWRTGAEYLAETSRTYSGEFFEFCRRGGHRGYTVSSHPRADRVDDGAMQVENRPKRIGRAGLAYHRDEIDHGLSIVRSALAWRADAAVVDSGTTHWALLGLLRLASIPVLGVLHNTPWPAGFPPQRARRRLILATEAWFWRRIASALLSVSPECERQVRSLAGAAPRVALQFRAQFNRADFAACAPPPRETVPFRVLFAGRVERNKGVFDLLEMARILEHSRPGRVRFEVCGDGSALGALADAVDRQGLREVVRLRGRLRRPEMVQAYARSHVVVAPTRSDFPEGFAMVCAEAILSGRPVITSPVVPAAEVLRAATVLARTDDPASFAGAIARLQDDAAGYAALCGACADLREPFFDRRDGFAAALQEAFGALGLAPRASGDSSA